MHAREGERGVQSISPGHNAPRGADAIRIELLSELLRYDVLPLLEIGGHGWTLQLSERVSSMDEDTE